MHGLLQDSEPQHREFFVEREHELATLLAALDDAAAGRGSCALVTGELGIGKSRLCAELAEEAERRGFATLQAVADPLSSGVALAPVVSALTGFVTRRTGAAKTPLTKRLGTLGDLIAQPPAPEGRAADLTTATLFHALDDLLDAVTQAAPALLLLDDIEFLDEMTCRAVRHLATRGTGRPLLVVLAGRPRAGSALVVELADLVGQNGHRIALPRLTEKGIASVLSAPARTASGSTPDREVLTRVAGLPLYARALAEEPGRSVGRPPATVATRIEREIRRLPPDERSLFDVLMITATPVPFDLLAAMGPAEPRDCSAVLRRLIDRLLVVSADGSDDERFRPAHPMYTEWANAALPLHERRLVHAAIGWALDGSGDLDAAASHFLAAGPTASGPRYVPLLLEASRSAEAGGSDDDVVRYLQPLVDTPSVFSSSSELATCLEDLGRAYLRAGAVPKAEESWRRGMRVAIECSDTTRVESIRYRLAMLRVQQATVPETITAIQDAPHEDEDPAVRDLRALVWSARFGDARQVRASAVRLLEATRRSDSAAARCASELGRCVLDLLEGEIEAAHRHARRALALARTTPHTFLNSSSTRMLSRVSVLAGDLDGATTLAEGQLRELVEAGHDSTSLRVWMGLLRYFAGDLTGASEAASIAAASAAAAGAARAGASASTLAALVAAERGQGGRMRASLADVQRTYRDGMRVDRGLASFADAARSTLAYQMGAPDRIPDPGPDTFDGYPPVMCLRPLLAGLAGSAMAQPERTLRQAAYLRTLGRTSPVCSAFALRLEGLADTTAGRTEHGAELLREAADQLDHLGIRLHAAQAVVEWGESGAAGSATDAVALIGRALDTFEAQGVRFWADRARGVARSLGLEPARPRTGSALTARELEVAGLVARGLSNAAIARQLFLSERTVETHMRHIYAALGLSTRVEIARWLDLEDAPAQSR
ncbi:BREX system ATP-binding domain-containing protein [Mycetocola sp. 2940]|uniref:ATP-binding protein n=1 Tax=Mycetocola sp. 2940 TaxID=3156452 RepID=UPI00339801CA